MPYPIRYARAADGVRIAFTELGQGEPLIYATGIPWSNFTIGFTSPLTASHPEDVSAAARLIVYDPRGCGRSDHGVDDLSLDGFTRDIDAVSQALGLERFALYGSADAARVTIRYAAAHPERVTRLILWIPTISTAAVRGDGTLRAVSSLATRDWEMYLRTLAHAVVGGWDAERAAYGTAWADVMRASIRQDEFPRFREALRTHDVSCDLAAVRAPTLVLAREDAATFTVPVVGEVAAGIPTARLVVSPGNWLLPCTSEDITREIVGFMRSQEAPATRRNGIDAKIGDSPALSARELQVLALLSQGKTNAEIAADLVVAPSTASRHVHNILNKLGMSRRAEAAAYAARHGIAGARASR
jgi:pimeloyl-ACP methyl ester carboxylesterase/DNA-binding CsgD family transcriptional regulator